MTRLATSDPRILSPVESFDRNPWVSICQNGTLDLRTGSLSPHSPDDLITQVAGVPYIGDHTSPILDKFLGDTFAGDPDLRHFVHRACGYSLTGSTREEMLFFP